MSYAARSNTRPGSPIPAELRARPQWVVWRKEARGGKPTKVPYQACKPKQKAESNDPKTWATFDQAKLAAKLHRFDGIGYVFAEDDPYVGVDLDNCLAEDGEVLAWARPYVLALASTYGEVSPSGRGIKFIARGRLEAGGKTRKGLGEDGTGRIEVYDRGRYFAITGDAWDTQVTAAAELPEVLARIYADAAARPAPTSPAAPKTTARKRAAGTLSDEDRARRYLARVDPAVEGHGGHNQTFKAACKLVEFGLDEEAVFRLLWEDFNHRCRPPWSEKELRHKATDAVRENAERRGAKLEEERPARNGKATSNGRHDPPAGGDEPAGQGDEIRPNESPDDPHRLARLYRDTMCRNRDGLTLRGWRDEHYRWDGSAYRVVSEREIRAELAAVV